MQSAKASRMVYLKLCPRCRGDVHVNRDMYGEYRECLQCGYMEDVASSNRFANLRKRVSEMEDVA